MTDFSSVATRKIDIRTDVLTARRRLTEAQRAAAGAAVRRAAVELVGQASTVAAYVPVGSEPGGGGLPEELARAMPPGGRLLLPILLPDLDLDWATWRPGLPLEVAGFGMREPLGPRLGPLAVRAATVVIVPGLAADRHGRRLGRGGGSYDRALARVDPAALTVVLLHDGELRDALPADPHDQPVRAAITPATGLVRLDGKAPDDALLALE